MFLSDFDKKLSKDFLNQGYIIRPVKEINLLKKISNTIVQNSSRILKKKLNNPAKWFNDTHKSVSPEKLNNFRLSLYKAINKEKFFRQSYFNLAQTYIESLVGNELVMQNRVNLSIQLPNDSSSLLPLHSDTWSGDSPFEIVVWLPLVDCYKTKSMFILDPKKSSKFYRDFNNNGSKSSNQIFNKIKKDLKWIDVKYGEVLLFNQSLPHGNVINQEKSTRWSMNCRFKSLFSPYGDKKLGEFFEPITVRPATEVGIAYKEPS